MSDAARNVTRLLVIALAAFAAWRVIATGLADHLVERAPEQALAWEPHNPRALLRIATSQLDDHKPEAAAASARALLQFEPLSGEAFAILAKAAEGSGDEVHLATLYRLAVRHAPHDTYAESWLTESLLRAGKTREAIEQFDTLFRVSPLQGGKFLPLFAQLCAEREFADSVSARLGNNPLWKTGMLAALLERDDHDAIDRVFGSLQQAGKLSAHETGQWLDQLMQEGFWGEAYSRWVSGLRLTPQRFVPPLYNGSFETEPSGIGFDWRIVPTAGVLVDRSEAANAGSYVLDVTFSGRRVPEINIEQRLFLAPGNYLLRFRARAESLRSDKGLQWAIQCRGNPEPIALSTALGGSFDWKQFDQRFDVPADCPAQRLWLRNPGADAAGKEVSGVIRFTDFAITARSEAANTAPVTKR